MLVCGDSAAFELQGGRAAPSSFLARSKLGERHTSSRSAQPELEGPFLRPPLGALLDT